MKIVHVCICGGWYEKNAYQDQILPRYHRKLGHDVTIIASFYSRWNMERGCYDIDQTKEKYLNDGVKILRLHPTLPLALNRHIHLFRGLGNAIRREKPDLIFLHGVESPNYLQVASYCKHHVNVKLVCDNHADRVNSLHHWITRLWSQLIVRRVVVKKLLPLTTWFYGVTTSRCEFLTQEFGIPQEKVRLLVMGADDDNMHQDRKDEIRKQVRSTYNISDNDFLIVTGGRIDKKKYSYFFDLTEAVCKIKEKHLKLIVFGPIVDDVKILFERFPSDKVLLIGAIPSDSVYDYFFAADLVVFTGLHSVMWEQAVASKVPCMFRKIEGFNHVDIGGNCMWLEGEGEEYYQKVIEKVLYSSDIYESLKKSANHNSANSFLYSIIAQQVLDDVYSGKVL